MPNELRKQLFHEWVQLKNELAKALDNKDENGLTQTNAKIAEFAKANNIDLSKPVIQIVEPIPEPEPTTTGAIQIPYKTTGKSWQFVDSGKKERTLTSRGIKTPTTEYNSIGMENRSNLAAVIYYTHPLSCTTPEGNETNVKLWGPKHDSKNPGCCWCMSYLNGKGDVGYGLEGEHPKTKKCVEKFGNIGSIQGKNVGLMSIIWKIPEGAHLEVWIDLIDGNGFKKIGQYEGKCGLIKKSTEPVIDQQVQFRLDCPEVVIKSAVVYEIIPPS